MKSCLRNETIVIRPVEENPAMHIPKGKNGHIRFEGSFTTYDAPMAKHGKGVMPVLTADEQEYLESILDSSRGKGWLSSYAENSAWTGRSRYKIELGLDEVELRLFDPVEFIQYKILLSNRNDIAPSYESRQDRQYMFYMESKESLDKGKLEKVTYKIEAGQVFAEIAKSNDKLIDTMLVVFRGDYSKVPKGMTANSAKVTLYNYIERDPQGFLDIVRGSEFDVKVQFYKARRRGYIQRNGYDYNLGMGDGRLIGKNMAEVLDYIRDLATNESKEEQYLKFQAALKNN